jgi:hypothetical protein
MPCVLILWVVWRLAVGDASRGLLKLLLAVTVETEPFVTVPGKMTDILASVFQRRTVVNEQLDAKRDLISPTACWCPAKPHQEEPIAVASADEGGSAHQPPGRSYTCSMAQCQHVTALVHL